MKKMILFLSVFFIPAGAIFAQRTKPNLMPPSVEYFPDTLRRYPKGVNKTTANASFNIKTDSLIYEAPVKDFVFSDPRLQDQFNSKDWIESDKFPLLSFRGKMGKFSFTGGREWVYVKGNLTLHGVTKTIVTQAELIQQGLILRITLRLVIKPADFNISGKTINETATQHILIMAGEFFLK